MSETPSPGSAPSPYSPRHRVDVLIAEDSRIQAKMLEKRLVDAGHTVRWAINGAKAVELLKEKRPELIISDIEMPEMNG